MKKWKVPQPTERLLIFILLLIIALNVTVLGYFGFKINILWEQAGNGSFFHGNVDNNQPVNAETRFYIQDSLKSLYPSQPATDVSQDRVYIPEAKIYLPLTAYSRTLVYRYSDADGSSPAVAQFSTSTNVDQLPETFNDVPCLQRYASFSINSKDGVYGYGDFVTSISLTDGRTLNLYQHDNKGCNQTRWSGGAPDKIIDLLKQAKSY